MASLLDAARVFAGPDARKMAERVLKRSIRRDNDPGSDPKRLKNRIAKVKKAVEALDALTFYGPSLEEMAMEADAVLEKLENSLQDRSVQIVVRDRR
ncbi:MAG: hypothetical protein HY921_06510 [Elusimicrobia bacterium]|nr:hypothetical protein [Elusimicrobiota bacterium]